MCYWPLQICRRPPTLLDSLRLNGLYLSKMALWNRSKLFFSSIQKGTISLIGLVLLQEETGAPGQNLRCLVESNWKHSSQMWLRWNYNQTTAHCTRNQTQVTKMKDTRHMLTWEMKWSLQASLPTKIINPRPLKKLESITCLGGSMLLFNDKQSANKCGRLQRLFSLAGLLHDQWFACVEIDYIMLL
jgi:hypothetical protein